MYKRDSKSDDAATEFHHEFDENRNREIRLTSTFIRYVTVKLIFCLV